MGKSLIQRLKTKVKQGLFRLALASSVYFGSGLEGRVYADTINVPQDYSTIQSAIDNSQHGDEIIVQPGTYIENINLNGKNIILRSTEPTNRSVVEQTIIDGNQQGSVVTFSRDEGTSCTLEGFTITNGYARMGGGGITGNNNSAT
ncbi:MAG: hypothetical protein AABY22_22100, partial [Nanoarchaeota archaeon]